MRTRGTRHVRAQISCVPESFRPEPARAVIYLHKPFVLPWNQARAAQILHGQVRVVSMSETETEYMFICSGGRGAIHVPGSVVMMVWYVDDDDHLTLGPHVLDLG